MHGFEIILTPVGKISFFAGETLACLGFRSRWMRLERARARARQVKRIILGNWRRGLIREEYYTFFFGHEWDCCCRSFNWDRLG